MGMNGLYPRALSGKSWIPRLELFVRLKMYSRFGFGRIIDSDHAMRVILPLAVVLNREHANER
jgi:hypothetical protein